MMSSFDKVYPCLAHLWPSGLDRSIETSLVRIPPMLLRNLGKFVYPRLPQSLGIGDVQHRRAHCEYGAIEMQASNLTAAPRQFATVPCRLAAMPRE